MRSLAGAAVAIVAACGVACSMDVASLSAPDGASFGAGAGDAGDAGDAVTTGADQDAAAPKHLQTTRVAVLNTGSNTPWPFRLCIEGVKRAFPADAPMPQANYPGVPVGGVAMLTAAEGDSDLQAFLDGKEFLDGDGGDAGLVRKITALSARDIANNPADFVQADCSAWMQKFKTDFLHRFEVGTIAIEPGAINLIVVDGVSPNKLRVSVPATNNSWIVGNFSAAAPGTMTASLGGPNGAPPVPAVALFGKFSDPVTQGVLTPFEAYNVRVTAPLDRSYSLAQIAAATDSTKTPGALLSSTPSFALLFVGDDARDGGPGTEAHFVALPLEP